MCRVKWNSCKFIHILFRPVHFTTYSLLEAASPLVLAAAVACERGITFSPWRPWRPCRVLMLRVPPWKPGGSSICWAPPCCSTSVPPWARNACEASTTVWWPPGACDVKITFCKQHTLFSFWEEATKLTLNVVHSAIQISLPSAMGVLMWKISCLDYLLVFLWQWFDNYSFDMGSEMQWSFHVRSAVSNRE